MSVVLGVTDGFASCAAVSIRDVPGTGFWNNTSTLKQYFILPKNGSKYYLKYTFLVFPVLGIFGLGTPLVSMVGPLARLELARRVVEIVFKGANSLLDRLKWPPSLVR